jgi:DNA-binding MarR family transcriptional regulator
MIERQIRAGDLRIVSVRLTSRGQALATSVDVSWSQVAGDLLKGFNDKERRQLRQFLKRMSKNLTGLSHSPE